MAGPLDDDPLVPPPDAPAIHNHTPGVVWTMPWRFTPARHVLVVIAKLTCRLVPNGPCAFLDEPDPPSGDVHWDDDPACSLRYASDFVPYKPRADILLTGHAYARGDDRTTARVHLKLAGVDRVLSAIGDRSWTSTGLQGPAPFEAIPLRWECTYGGADYGPNPVGLGAGNSLRQGRIANLEDPRFPIVGSVEDPKPACTAPIAPSWAQRATKVGDFTGDWHRTRWPLLPESFDYAYFNAAPHEQQSTHLRGDEPYLLAGVHPEFTVIQGTLPTKRPRVYAERRPGAGGEFYEVRLALDTVHFMPDDLKVVLLWRGAVDVADPWGTDLLALHVLSVDHDETLAPEAARERAHALRAQPPDVDSEDEVVPEDLTADPRAALAAAGAIGVPVFTEAEPPAPRPISREEIEALLARGETLAERDLTEADLSSLDLRGHDFSGALCERASFVGAKLDGATFTEASLAGADFRAASLRGAMLERADLTEVRLTEADLTEAVLTEATFARSVAPEVSFRSVKAEGADFTEATLHGADFRAATLTGADFTLAHVERGDFTEATLDDARMNESWASGIRLERAQLQDFRAESADFRDAHVTNAKADGALWQASRLDGARFDGSSLNEALFARAVLDGASFARATAVEADFRRARMRGVVMLRANLMKARFEGADLTGADLRGANLYEAELREAHVDGADWSLAVVTGSGLDRR
jgi:uncharacterized protein YjbI with pentapeptide repeats